MTLAEFRDWLEGFLARQPDPHRPEPRAWVRILREAAEVAAVEGRAVLVDLESFPVVSAEILRSAR